MTDPGPFTVAICRVGPDSWMVVEKVADQAKASMLLALDEQSARAEAAARFRVPVDQVAVISAPPEGEPEPNV